MAHHEPIGKDEIYCGNVQRGGDRLAWLKQKGMTTARLGEVALDWDGNPLPRTLAPLIIDRKEEMLYDDIMMTKTFGPDWKRYGN